MTTLSESHVEQAAFAWPESLGWDDKVQVEDCAGERLADDAGRFKPPPIAGHQLALFLIPTLAFRV